jgi:hypothetical protein
VAVVLAAGHVFRRRPGTPVLVQAKSRELIALFGNTRRSILNAGAIPATARGHIGAMVRAARSW